MHRFRTLALEVVLALAPTLYGRYMGKGRGGAMPPLSPGSTRPPCGMVLVIDHDFPEPDRDAGSRAIASFIGLIQDCGYPVTVWVASTSSSELGRRQLVEKGVQCVTRSETGGLDEWLALSNPTQMFACVLSRPLIAAMHLPTVRRHFHGTCLYYGHDIHYRRLQAMATTCRPTARARWEMWMLRRVEHRLWRDADVILYPSTEEVDHVRQWLDAHGMHAVVEAFPLWTFKHTKVDIAPSERRAGLLFVGSMAHAPNVDGLDWFISEVMPKLEPLGSAAQLRIVGSGMEAYAPPRADLPVTVMGRVDDASLGQCYASARAVVAPLRFGGGVKGKVVEAIAHGVPVVMTPVGAQGLDGIERLLPVTDDAVKFASEISRFLLDDAAWLAASISARALLAERFDHARVQAHLAKLLDSKGNPPAD